MVARHYGRNGHRHRWSNINTGPSAQIRGPLPTALAVEFSDWQQCGSQVLIARTTHCQPAALGRPAGRDQRPLSMAWSGPYLQNPQVCRRTDRWRGATCYAMFTMHYVRPGSLFDGGLRFCPGGLRDRSKRRPGHQPSGTAPAKTLGASVRQKGEDSRSPSLHPGSGAFLLPTSG